jgi:hypothetical protein
MAPRLDAVLQRCLEQIAPMIIDLVLKTGIT